MRRRPRCHEAGRREAQGVVRRHAVGRGQCVLRHRHRARIGVEIRHVADRSLIDPVRHGAALVRDDARIGAVPHGDVLRAGRRHVRRDASRDRHGIVARLERAGGERERDRRARGDADQTRVRERLRRIGSIEQTTGESRDARGHRRAIHGHRHRRHRRERALHAPHARDAQHVRSRIPRRDKRCTIMGHEEVSVRTDERAGRHRKREAARVAGSFHRASNASITCRRGRSNAREVIAEASLRACPDRIADRQPPPRRERVAHDAYLGVVQRTAVDRQLRNVHGSGI